MAHSQRNRSFRIMIRRIHHDAITIRFGIRYNRTPLCSSSSIVVVIFQNGKDIFTNLPRGTVAEVNDVGGVCVRCAVDGDFDLEASGAETEEWLIWLLREREWVSEQWMHKNTGDIQKCLLSFTGAVTGELWRFKASWRNKWKYESTYHDFIFTFLAVDDCYGNKLRSDEAGMEMNESFVSVT